VSDPAFGRRCRRQFFRPIVPQGIRWRPSGSHGREGLLRDPIEYLQDPAPKVLFGGSRRLLDGREASDRGTRRRVTVNPHVVLVIPRPALKNDGSDRDALHHRVWSAVFMTR
jgi:hypothetical protein